MSKINPLVPTKIILDKDKVSSVITPTTIMNYIEKSGQWSKYDTSRDFVKIYQYDHDETFAQINVPLLPSLSDYNEAIYECIKRLANVYNVDEIEMASILLDEMQRNRQSNIT